MTPVVLGSVYFIREGRDGPVKIGWTQNEPERRRDNLQIGNSRKLHLIGVLPNVEEAVESEWHQKYSDTHIRGEWFFPTGPLLRAIDAACPKPEVAHPPAPSVPVTEGAEPNLAPLTEWMTINGVRQIGLCRLTGLSTGYVSQIFAGVRPLNLGVARRFELATGGAVKAADLLGLSARRSGEVLSA